MDKKPEIIRATCPVHGASEFVLFDVGAGAWWKCRGWIENWSCTSCIFEEDVTPDGAEVRQFVTVIEGVLDACRRDGSSMVMATTRMERARGMYRRVMDLDRLTMDERWGPPPRLQG